MLHVQLVQCSMMAVLPQAPIQRLADRIASWFVPTIVSLALLTFTAWAIVVGVASHDPRVSMLYNALHVSYLAIPSSLPPPPYSLLPPPSLVSQLHQQY